MPKRRADADHRRFFDEFECVKIPRLRAMGVVQLDAPHAIIQIGDRRKLIRLAHSKLANEGSWSFFRCPRCARRCNRLWLIDDRPLCVKCCNVPERLAPHQMGLRQARTSQGARPKARRAGRQDRRDHAVALQSGAQTLARQSTARRQQPRPCNAHAARNDRLSPQSARIAASRQRGR